MGEVARDTGELYDRELGAGVAQARAWSRITGATLLHCWVAFLWL